MTSIGVLTPCPPLHSGEGERREPGGGGLHAATLRRRRQHAVQAQVIRFLAVMIGPVAHGDEDCARARQVHPEHRDRLGQLRVVHFCERLLTKLKRLFQTRHELFLRGRAVDRGALRGGNAGSLAAQDVVALVREVHLDLGETHLRRRRPVVVLVRRHRFGGGDQDARIPLLHVAQRIGHRTCRRRGGGGGGGGGGRGGR